MPLSAEDPESVGGYRLEERLGSGGMGVVYHARSGSGRRVAVKVVYQQFADDTEFRARFRREVTAARRVSGAFTAAVVDADPDAVRPWMATSYIPGPTLAQQVAEKGPLDSVGLRKLAVGLAEALRDIHRVGVVHRDLKPSNVILSEDGPRVIDFGISRASDQQHLTTTGRVMGTPPFMSPEQFRAPKDVGPETDVFSLASVLVHAASGHSPFEAENAYMTAYHVVHDPPRLDGLPEVLRGVVTDCLDKEPSKRPSTDELLERLRKVSADGLPQPRVVPVVADPVPRRARRRRRVVVGALAAVVGTCAAVVLAVGLPDGAPRSPEGKSSQSPSVQQLSPTDDSYRWRDAVHTVLPDEVKASRSYRGHGPELAFDREDATWWGPGVTGSGAGEWIEGRFDAPTRVSELVFTSGMSTQLDAFGVSAMPKRVTVTFTTDAGKAVERDLMLNWVVGGQHFVFDVGKVLAVRFTVKSSYQADEKAQENAQVAISGVELLSSNEARAAPEASVEAAS
ncbi:serine/threonine-protein kinase [Streptomyces coelicoflavus]|uniref:serine/threonine-protein kinase n=1 Tax=Streptomyces coelicoflavus TaxID=285562 RepID=UPI00363CB6EC